MIDLPQPLIHIGFSKAASTWLQKAVFTEQVGYQSIMSHTEVQLDIIEPTPFVYRPIHVHNIYRQRVEKQPDKIPVITSEALSGNMYCGGYNARQNADRLFDSFPNGRILLMVREQKSMLRALYKSYMDWGLPHSLGRLLEPHEPTRFPQFNFEWINYALMTDYYRSLFGPDNVLVLPYELLLHDKRTLLEDIAEFSGLPADIDELMALPRINRRFNESRALSTLYFQRWFNSVFISNGANYSGLFKSRRNQGIYKVRRKLEPLMKLPSFIDEKLERGFQDKVRGAFEGVFTEGNRELQTYCKHDLGALGYDL